jgi:4-oxalocrotonate tautomerase
MPIVRIDLFSGRTQEQKAAAAREVTEALARTLNAPPDTTQVIFTEFEKSHWAKGGVMFDAK